MPPCAQAFCEPVPKRSIRLENHSEVKLRAYARHPDYRSELDGAVVAGRALEPLPFDGRLLGEAFKLVRPPLPEFTLLGGMMVDRTDIGHLLSSTKSVKSLLHSTKLLARHARDRLAHGRGTRLVMGNALVGRLLYSLIRRDVDILNRRVAYENCPGCRRACDQRGSGVRRRFARDRHRWRTDFGGWRIQSPRRATARGAWNRRGMVLRRIGRERGCTGQGDRDRCAHQRQGFEPRILGAGVDPAPTGWVAGGVSALRARPRQTGDAGGRQQRAAFS